MLDNTTSVYYNTKRFVNWICFRPQVKREKLCWIPQKELTSITGPKFRNVVVLSVIYHRQKLLDYTVRLSLRLIN
jgi:hypothetical protein